MTRTIRQQALNNIAKALFVLVAGWAVGYIIAGAVSQ